MTFLRRLWFLLTRRRRQAELEEEMRLHVELREARNRRNGLAADQAARAARVRFGSTLKLREDSRDAWGFQMVDALGQDLQFAIRQLRRRPTWTLAIVLTLALGVGANTSVFAVVEALLSHPANGSHPDELAWIGLGQIRSGQTSRLSYPTYQTLRDQSTTFSGLLAYTLTPFAIGGKTPSLVQGSVVTGNYFDVLGIRASRGRLLTPSDDQPAAPRAVVLSDAIWHRAFGADPNIVGTSVAINGQPFSIVGVAPPDFGGVEFGERNELWVPLSTLPVAIPGRHNLLTDPGATWLAALGRFKASTTIAQAQAELTVITASTSSNSVPADQRLTAVLTSGTTGPPWRGQPAALVISLVSLVPIVVMLVGCANVANAVMAHHVGRQREFAMRRAIGASRARLLTQLLVEATVLAALAAIVGFALSFGLTILVATLGGLPPEETTLAMPGPRMIGITGFVALLSTLVFGLLPAMRTSRVDLLPALKDETGAITATRRGRLFQRVFIVTQVALSLTLLVCSGLFLQSLRKALEVDTGFTPKGAVSLEVDPNLAGYSDARRTNLVDRLIADTRATPGVTAVGVTTAMPLANTNSGQRPVSRDGAHTIRALDSSVSPGFFDAIGVPLIEGRPFTQEDAVGSAPVAIINESLAARLWPRQHAIGQDLIEDVRPGTRLEIVGVCRDMKYAGIKEPAELAYYRPYAQTAGRRASPVVLVGRTVGDEAALLRTLRGFVTAIEPDMPVSHAATLSDTVRAVTTRQQAVAAFLAVFGALTLLLTTAGIYGVASHSASLRTREIGVRVALGARPAEIRRLVMGESLVVSAIGVAVGLGVSTAGSRLLKSFLDGLTATDALTFAGGALVLCVVTVVASYGPARQATRVDPILALKQE